MTNDFEKTISDLLKMKKFVDSLMSRPQSGQRGAQQTRRYKSVNKYLKS